MSSTANMNSTATETEKSHSKIVHCNSCHRDDVHTPVELTPGLIVAFVMTLGLVALFRPYRCATCGETRPVFFLKR